MSVLSVLRDAIPPPSYITMPSTGVDISDTSLKYIKFEKDKRSGAKLEIHHWGDIDIEDGALRRGTLADPKKLTDVLREVKDRTKDEHIRVSLPEERAYLFETEIKRGTPFKEIRGMLEFKLEENVPLSPRDAFFDYDIVLDDLRKDVYRVVVTVYARDTVMAYYEACRAAGVTPLSFEVEAQAIARAALLPDSREASMIVDFGKSRTGVGIVQRGTLMYASTIDIGGNELSNALISQLGPQAEPDLTKIKNTLGLVREVDNSDVYDALITTLSAIKDELLIRINYWNDKVARQEDRQISNIVLCGGSANLKGLPGYLTEALQIETKRANVWANAFDSKQIVPPINRRHAYGYATAIGLALADFV